MIVDDVTMARHRMGGIISIIRENISIVMDDLHGSSNANQRKMLSNAISSVDRLLRFTDNYFFIQKLDAGIIGPNPEMLDLNMVAEAACSKFRDAAGSKGNKIILKLDDGLPKTKFDGELIGIVIENMLSNAVDFTDKGTIVVTTSVDGDSIRLSVADSGCGMSEEEVPRLFNKFEKLSNNRARMRSSDGLGLALSMDIVEKHDGRIWLESTSAKGSTFVISLPIRS